MTRALDRIRASPLASASLLVAILVVILIPDLAAERPYLLGDDYLFLAELEGHDVIPGQPADLTHFGHRGAQDAWNLPWWADDDFRIRQFRRLTSVIMEAEHAALGVNPRAFKLINTLLVVIVVVLVALFYRRCLEAMTARWAVLLFAGALPGLAFIANWYAAIHHPLATIAVLGGILPYVRYRLQRPRLAMGAALAWLAIGLLLSETGLVLVLYVVVYELVVVPVRGPRGGPPIRWQDRFGVLVLFAGIGAAYLVWHQSMGYGGRETPVYLDPLSPGSLLELPPRLLFVASLGMPIVTLPVLALAGIGIFLGRGALSAESKRMVLFSAICWLATALYFSLTAPDPRVIVIPAIGQAPVVATGVVALWRWAGRLQPHGPPARLTGSLLRLAAASSIVAVVGVAGARTVIGGQRMARKQVLERHLFDRLVESAGDERVLVLMQPSVPIFHTHWLPILRARALVDHGVDLRVVHLAPPGERYDYRRVDEHTLELRFEPWLRWWFPPYRQQCDRIRVEHPIMTVTATCAGDLLASARFRFHLPLDDARIGFVLVTRDGLHHLSPPAPGRVWELPDTHTAELLHVEPPPWIGRARRD